MPEVDDDARVGTPQPDPTPVQEWLARRPVLQAGTDLEPGEIAAVLEGLAARPELVAHRNALRPAAGARAWQRLYRDAHVDVWVIAWAAGADTGWHDHDSSSGALRVLAGAVTQERPRWTGDHDRQRVPAGEGLSFGPDHVHRVTVAEARAVTIHAYSPPLCRMGQYSFDPSGALQRRSVAYRYPDELRAALAP